MKMKPSFIYFMILPGASRASEDLWQEETTRDLHLEHCGLQSKAWVKQRVFELNPLAEYHSKTTNTGRHLVFISCVTDC